MATVRVLYSCHPCGLRKVPCEVPERGETEGIADWVGHTLSSAVTRDHMKRSPGCTSKKMDEVMIPTTGTDRIGGVMKQ